MVRGFCGYYSPSPDSHNVCQAANVQSLRGQVRFVVVDGLFSVGAFITNIK